MNTITTHPGELEFVSRYSRYEEMNKKKRKEINDNYCHSVTGKKNDLLSNTIGCFEIRNKKQKILETKDREDKNMESWRKKGSKWKKFLLKGTKSSNSEMKEARKNRSELFIFSQKRRKNWKFNEAQNKIVSVSHNKIRRPSEAFPKANGLDPPLRDLPLIPFSPSNFPLNKYCVNDTRRKLNISDVLDKSLDKVIGEAKKELFIERMKGVSDGSDYIYINTDHDTCKNNYQDVEEDDYMDMNTVRIQHRLYTY